MRYINSYYINSELEKSLAKAQMWKVQIKIAKEINIKM